MSSTVLDFGKRLMNRLRLGKSKLNSLEVMFDFNGHTILNLQILVHKDDIKQLEKLVNDNYNIRAR